MGVLNATNQWRNAMGVLPIILASALLPMLSACNQVQHGKEQQWRQLEASHGLIALGIWPLALGLASFAHVVLSLYGSGFASGRAIFILIVAGMVITTSQIPISNLIVARGWLWLGLGFNMLTSAILLLTSYLLVPKYGGIGVALGTYVSQLIQLVLLVPYLALRGELPHGFSLRLLAGMTSVTALMLIVLAFDEQLANFLFVPLLLAALTICYWSMSRWLKERLLGFLKPVANRVI
jgi:O-antigen/teichoic acid export membrane protein